MFDEPDEPKPARTRDPAQRAKEKADELCIHAELAAVFEGPRKFDAELRVGLDANVARSVQRAMATLAKSKDPEHPILPVTVAGEAAELLGAWVKYELTPGDYHMHRRPGELMIVRWLEAGLVDTFYGRLQAHFDAALEGVREDERQTHGWKQEPEMLAYLKALDDIDLKMPDRYLRDIIAKHHAFVLSTLTADELNIMFLAEDVMGMPAADLVGEASAPPEDATDADKAWFFKLFALRGIVEDVERMCFFAFLQKTEESW